MARVYNFSAGPSMLPLPVLHIAGEEICDAKGSGQSVMEMSHRSDEFGFYIKRTRQLLRHVLKIPDDYEVLFLQGGAMTQFAMAPVNLAGVETGEPRRKATYVDTGVWASKAIGEARKYVDVRVAASSGDRNYTYIPDAPPPEAGDAFYYICYNNTIFGTKWTAPPDTGSVPLVADISSCIASEPLDVSRFGLLFAGAQKNLGPAGCTVVIVRRDLIRDSLPAWVPSMLRYDIHAKEKSMFNTPPCFAIYMMYLVLLWIEDWGGTEEMGMRNRKKSALLYDCLDASRLFSAPVEPPYRSLMNVPFVVNEPDADRRAVLEKRFLTEAASQGLVNLAGHRLAGGMRASLYNAMPPEGVQALVAFIEKFEKDEKKAARAG